MRRVGRRSGKKRVDRERGGGKVGKRERETDVLILVL